MTTTTPTVTPTTDQNAEAVSGLRPSRVFDFFASLNSVPRPSHHEEAIQQHVLGHAAAAGFTATRDDTGNIVVTVPATPGRESAPTIVLQGHLDMVAEKNRGVEHDFLNDPIRLVRDDEDGATILRADGTTLGADNGIGVALAWAAATDPEIAHGPLELLLTSDEEVGMTGAKELTPSSFTGRTLINLDSEEDDAIYIGCAGGCDVTITWTLDLAPVTTETLIAIEVTGLAGGHSGCDIHLGRVNALKAAAAVWWETGDASARVVAYDGGSKRNAIPREATLVLAIDPAQRAAYVAAANAICSAAVADGEAKASIEIADRDRAAAASIAASQAMLRSLVALPSGVQAVVPHMTELVQTSNNLSTSVTVRDDTTATITAGCMTRSSKLRDTHDTAQRVRATAELGGAAVEIGNAYPGWQPSPTSAALDVAQATYRDLFGAEPIVTAIHAGLECGIIGERVAGDGAPLDMISIGPRIEGAHSPDERVWPESVEKSYRLLGALLDRLSQPR